MAAENKKRILEDASSENLTPTEDDSEWIGPTPAEAILPKKRKVLPYEHVYLQNLPDSESYEKSYMHRDIITHVATTKTDFLITASYDGHVKFWKKLDHGIEFVKHFRAHLGSIHDMTVSCNGEFCATVSEDKAMKVFDVINFDMINMIKLGYVAKAAGWIFAAGDPVRAIAVSEKESSKIYIYDGTGGSEPIKCMDRLHASPPTLIKFNPIYEVIVSSDPSGMLEYWTGPKSDYKFPKSVLWKFKTDTDLYEFAKCKSHPTEIAFSPNGKIMGILATDRKIRVFKFLTGKLSKVLDESLQTFTELQQRKQQLPNMEFGRRIAIERELEKSDSFTLCNLVFDQSSNFMMYATMLGIKVINLHSNTCVKFLGMPENARFIQIALFQGAPKKYMSSLTVEMQASENPVLQNVQSDPTLFCTAFKKNRFYMFTRREPEDTKSADADRDVFNEKPTKEELVAATQESTFARTGNSCIIHTSMGDIHCKLFAKECPKTIENFCVHSKKGYYNGHIFHRVIKRFMIQTGDPQGNGTGGESIWGGEFEDEFHPSLRHDRPYTLSMANAGPNTNGSQFFITVVPTPWLDNKHTVFGRVVKGLEVAQNISNVKADFNDKPYDEVKVISVTIK